MRGYVKRVVKMLQKLSDEQVKQFLNAVADENDMFDSILESLATGLIIVDGRWKLLQSNKSAERYLPFSVRIDDPKNENLVLWEIVEEPDIAAFFKDCGEKDKTNVSEEFTTSTSGGSQRFITVSIIPFVKQSKIEGNIIKIDDITEKRSREVLLRRMENMAGLTNLAAGMAHEIKNPLGAISIHIQLIQKSIKKKRDGDGMLPDRKFLEEHLDVVNEEINRLNNLVMDFLFAVRPVNAQLALVEPSGLIKNIADFFTPEFNKSHIDVNLKLPEKSPRLMIDEKLFREVIINIVQNAFAAVKERYPQCSYGEKYAGSECPGLIEINASVKYDKYVINIADNGCGMSEDTMSRIFEPYFTTKANGTGLGMTMVYKIIKEFSGDIQVKSRTNDGTQFTVTLPVPQTDRKLLTEGGHK